MYCGNCGAKMLEGASFCSGCGTQITKTSKTLTSAPTQQSTMPSSCRTIIKVGSVVAALSVLIIIGILISSNVDGRSGINGTWIHAGRGVPAHGHQSHITFRGNNFTLIEYARWGSDMWAASFGVLFGMHLTEVAEIARTMNLNNSWRIDSVVYELLEPNITGADYRLLRATISGRYIINNDRTQIEFEFDDGRIFVFSFSETDHTIAENTITISGTRLARR